MLNSSIDRPCIVLGNPKGISGPSGSDVHGSLDDAFSSDSVRCKGQIGPCKTKVLTGYGHSDPQVAGEAKSALSHVRLVR